MRNVLKMVYGNQKEVKLESQVFEFGLIDDLKSAIKEAKRIKNLQEDGVKWFDKAENEFKQYLKLHSDALGIINSSTKQVKNTLQSLEKTMNEAEKLSKELGVRPNSIKEYVDAVKISNEIIDSNRNLFYLKDRLEKFKV